MRDLGAFYPTARMAAVQWWEMIVAGGPAMFSIDASAARQAWADYLRSAVDFGHDVLSGWSTSITATGLDATTHTCVPELYGIGECRKVRRNKLVPIVGTGHRSVYLDYLLTLFELEKLAYEVAYERAHRPDWEAIPLGGLQALVERVGS